MRSYGQATADYIVGIMLFLFGVSLIFYFSLNVISPVTQESSKNQYLAESISEYLLSYLHQDRVYKTNAINTTKLNQLLAMDETSLYNLFSLVGSKTFDVNITVKSFSNPYIVVGAVGKPYGDLGNFGYVERLVVDYSNPSNIYIIEVRVW